MKRFHVHAHFDGLQASVVFYSSMYAAVRARLEADDARWILQDLRVDFAISS